MPRSIAHGRDDPPHYGMPLRDNEESSEVTMTTQDAVSGPQREPDERVREALDRAARYQPVDANAVLVLTLAAEVRRLQAAQREPVAWRWRVKGNNGEWTVWCPEDSLEHAREYCRGTVHEIEPLYTQAQRDDHPTDSMGQGQPLPSLSVDTSVADRKDAARWRYLRSFVGLPWAEQPQALRDSDPKNPEEADAIIDAAMSADVRSQARGKS